MSNNENVNTIKEHSSTASTVARQIVFALAAVAWACIFIEKKQFQFNLLPSISLLLVIVYFFIDLLQYLYSATKSRKIEIDYFFAVNAEIGEDEKIKIEENYYFACDKMEKVVFHFFYSKFFVLLLILIVTLLYIITQLM